MIIGFIALDIETAAFPDGKTYGFWASGHVVYEMCIIFANIVLLQMTNNWTGWGEVIIFLQVLSYYGFHYINTVLFKTNVVHGIFDSWASYPYHWIAVLLGLCSVTMIDYGFGFLIRMILVKLEWIQPEIELKDPQI